MKIVSRFESCAAIFLASSALLIPAKAVAQKQDVQAQLDAARARLSAQQDMLDRQETRLRALEAMVVKLSGSAAAEPDVIATQAVRPSTSVPLSNTTTLSGSPASAPPPPLERVGAAPEDNERPIELAVLGDQGSIVTRRGQLSGEFSLEYARADRNRAVFRGIELVESVLVGVFDINESRQDVLTGAASLRYGLTDALEIGVRLPYIYRSDASILAPVAGSTPNDAAATIDNSAKGDGIGDLELSARYQLTNGRGGWPFLIANLQGVIPTGRNPFQLRRDDTGRALEAATGAGFYGISPSVTAILPTDPAVLFGTLGYTFNFAKNVDTRIPPVIIDRVDPGDAISASAGIGLSLNQRTTLNLGYAHSWAFGSKTWTRLVTPTPQWPGLRTSRSRDLQIGRMLFGVTYRMTDKASLNWSVELGATEDATDLRTVLRIPLVLISGR